MSLKIITSLVVGMLISLNIASAAENNVSAKSVAPKAKSAEAKIDPAALEAAQKLFKTMKMEQIYNKMVDQATINLVARRPVLKKVQKDIRNFYEKYIGWRAIHDDIAKIYAKHFTPKEIEDLIAFYSTPTGQKALRMLPQIMAEGRRIGLQKVLAHGAELQAILIKALQQQQKQSNK